MLEILTYFLESYLSQDFGQHLVFEHPLSVFLDLLHLLGRLQLPLLGVLLFILDLPDGVLVHEGGTRGERLHGDWVEQPFNSYLVLALTLYIHLTLVLLVNVVVFLLLELGYLLLRDLHRVLFPQNLEPMHVHQSLGNGI